MRVYRSVCTYIWYDDKFPFASDDCQLVWFHIFTHPLSTQFGLIPHSLEGLAADKNRNKAWSYQRYSDAFIEGITLGFYEYDADALLIYFPKYFSPDNNQNRPGSPNTVISWAERWKTIPESPLKDKCFQSIKGMIEGMGEGFRKAWVKAWVMPSAIQEPKPKPKPKEDKEVILPGFKLEVEEPDTRYLQCETVRLRWNEIQGVKPCKKLAGDLQRRIAMLSREHDADWWAGLFLEITKAPFLLGKIQPPPGKKPFRVSLYWAAGPINLGKILAGNYADDQPEQRSKPKVAL